MLAKFIKMQLSSAWAFLCGGIAAVNVAILNGVNPSYEASWWKVAAAVAIAALLVPLCAALSTEAGQGKEASNAE